MKTLFFLCLFVLSNNLFAASLSTWDVYQNVSSEDKVEILKSTLHYLKEIERNTEIQMDEESVVKLWQEKIQSFLLSEAHAGTHYNCFYAGWPSKIISVKVNGVAKKYCSSPMKNNDLYKGKFKDSCKSGELLCNPIFFGAKLCVPNTTTQQKQLSLSQCEQKFKASKKTLSDVIAGAQKLGLDDDLKALFDLVDANCKQGGFQAKTPMCRNLEKKASELEAKYNLVSKKKVELPKKQANPTPAVTPKIIEEKKKVLVINDGGEIKEGNVAEDILKTVDNVSTVNTTNSFMPTTKNACLVEEDEANVVVAPTKLVDDEIKSPEERSEPIDQSQELPPDYCASPADVGGKGEAKYRQGKYSDDAGASLNIEYTENNGDKANRAVVGFDLEAGKYGTGHKYMEGYQEYPEEEMDLNYPSRSYGYEYKPRGPMNSFSVVDYPSSKHFDANGKLVESFSSTSMHYTQYFFFPRKVVPSVKKRDDGVYVTMTTGEQLKFDVSTGKLLDGVAKGNPDKNNVKKFPASASFKHAYPNTKTIENTYPDTKFSYEGGGIWIENNIASKDLRRPGNILPIRSKVDGKTYECKLKSETLFTMSNGYSLKPDEPGYLNSGYTCYRYTFKTDQELYKKIKEKCPEFKFGTLAQ